MVGRLQAPPRTLRIACLPSSPALPQLAAAMARVFSSGESEAERGHGEERERKEEKVGVSVCVCVCVYSCVCRCGEWRKNQAYPSHFVWSLIPPSGSLLVLSSLPEDVCVQGRGGGACVLLRVHVCMHAQMHACILSDRQTDRHACRRSYTDTDRCRETQTDRQTDRHSSIHIHTHTYNKRGPDMIRSPAGSTRDAKQVCKCCTLFLYA